MIFLKISIIYLLLILLTMFVLEWSHLYSHLMCFFVYSSLGACYGGLMTLYYIIEERK